MFSKHTFGARSYGHYQGYREKGDAGPGLTKAWRAAQKTKRLRAEAFMAAPPHSGSLRRSGCRWRSAVGKMPGGGGKAGSARLP